MKALVSWISRKRRFWFVHICKIKNKSSCRVRHVHSYKQNAVKPWEGVVPSIYMYTYHVIPGETFVNILLFLGAKHFEQTDFWTFGGIPFIMHEAIFTHGWGKNCCAGTKSIDLYNFKHAISTGYCYWKWRWNVRGWFFVYTTVKQLNRTNTSRLLLFGRYSYRSVTDYGHTTPICR